jgi:HEAT repeat protein
MRYQSSLFLLAFLALPAGCAYKDAPAESQADSTEADTTETARKPAEFWAHQLDSTFREAQLEALSNLGGYGHEAVPYIPNIARLLAAKDDSLGNTIGNTAAWALAHVGSEAYPVLRHALDSPNPLIRKRAAYGLGEAGPAAAEALGRLKTMAGADSVINVRWTAQWAVERLGGAKVTIDNKELARALLQGSVRKEAYRATGRISAGTPDALLMAGLDSDSLAVRLDAVHRLGSTGSSNVDVVPRLIQLLGDSVPALRRAAIDALIQKGSFALPQLQVALNHQRAQIRRGAMLAISGIKRGF